MASTTNQKIVQWVRGKKGQQVGRGECWDLADRALGHAGAASSPTTGPDDDYTWGDPVALDEVLPGDVLQFRDFTVETETTVDVTFSDGSGYTKTDEITVLREHHTGIVDAVLPSGALRIWEQNVKPLGKKVQLHVIPTGSSSRPPTVTHKLMKPESSGAARPAKVVETIVVTISGSLTAYRPQPR